MSIRSRLGSKVRSGFSSIRDSLSHDHTSEGDATDFWAGITVDDLEANGSTKKLSKRIRKEPIPNEFRGTIWRLQCAGDTPRATREKDFAEAQALPKLDGCHDLEQVCTWFATRPSVVSALRLRDSTRSRTVEILGCIAALLANHTGNATVYSPWLPPLIAFANLFMDKVDAFCMAVALLPSLNTRISKSPILDTRVDSWRMLYTFSRIAEKKLSSEQKSLWSDKVQGKHKALFEKSGAYEPGHPLGGFVTEWIWNLPHPTLSWVLDCFIIEGEKALYRIGLGIIHSCAQMRKSEEGSSRVLEVMTNLNDTDLLIRSSYSFKFRSALVARLRRKGTPIARHAAGCTGRNLGVLEDENLDTFTQKNARDLLKFGKSDSSIIPCIPNDAQGKIWKQLPARYQGCQAYRMFTTAQDGCRLETLYSCCADFSPLLLLFKSTDGAVFGAFLSHAFSQKKPLGKYFGSGECFIFQVTPDVAIYPWVGINNPNAAKEKTTSFFISASNDRLAIGGGGNGHALEIDESLFNCSSVTCDTFDNKCLVSPGNEFFKCSACEAWVLQDHEVENDN